MSLERYIEILNEIKLDTSIIYLDIMIKNHHINHEDDTVKIHLLQQDLREIKEISNEDASLNNESKLIIKKIKKDCYNALNLLEIIVDKNKMMHFSFNHSLVNDAFIPLTHREIKKNILASFNEMINLDKQIILLSCHLPNNAEKIKQLLILTRAEIAGMEILFSLIRKNSIKNAMFLMKIHRSFNINYNSLKKYDQKILKKIKAMDIINHNENLILEAVYIKEQLDNICNNKQGLMEINIKIYHYFLKKSNDWYRLLDFLINMPPNKVLNNEELFCKMKDKISVKIDIMNHIIRNKFNLAELTLLKKELITIKALYDRGLENKNTYLYHNFIKDFYVCLRHLIINIKQLKNGRISPENQLLSWAKNFAKNKISLFKANKEELLFNLIPITPSLIELNTEKNPINDIDLFIDHKIATTIGFNQTNYFSIHESHIHIWREKIEQLHATIYRQMNFVKLHPHRFSITTIDLTTSTNQLSDMIDHLKILKTCLSLFGITKSYAISIHDIEKKKNDLFDYLNKGSSNKKYRLIGNHHLFHHKSMPPISNNMLCSRSKKLTRTSKK